MEMLPTERVRLHGVPIEIKDAWLERKVLFLENQTKRLKESCIILYQKRVYRKRKKQPILASQEAVTLCQEICQENWSEQIWLLNTFKARAGCILGCLYVSQRNYDEALEYLSVAKELIETETLQYVIPETYVRIGIEMAKCYIDKHNAKEVVQDCLKKAEEVLYTSQEEICKNYQRICFDKLSLDLKLQEAFTEMDKYSGNSCDERAAYCLLREARQIYQDLPDLKKDAIPEKFCYEDWKSNKEVTLQTTRGGLFKNLYFQAGQRIDSLSKKDADTHLLEAAWKDIEMISGILNTEYEGEEKNGSEEIKKRQGESRRQESEECLKILESLQQSCLETALAIFLETVRKFDSNTICLNDIAALLYDAERRMEKEYLLNLISGQCPYRRESIRETIQAILDKVLTVENINMFALNMKADLSEAYDMPKRTDDYPALRQSFLKKWFQRLEEKSKKSQREERQEEKEPENKMPEPMQNILMSLVVLYNHVIKFASSAVIDFNDETWKELKVGHYTRMKVLPKLINPEGDTRLRLHQIHHLNDPREGAILIDRLKELFAAGKTCPLREMLWNLYASDRNGAVRNSVYMGSFTSRLDQLNMWDRYGDGGKGISIQFCAGSSFDKDPQVSLCQISTSGNTGRYKIENVKYPLYMVLYLPDREGLDLEKEANYAKHRAKAAREKGISNLEAQWWERQYELIGKLGELERKIKISLEQIEENFSSLEPETQNALERELCNTIMVILDVARFLIKSDSYRDEREYRIIQYSAAPDCITEGVSVPKLFIPAEKRMEYEKVCFGPLVRDFESKAAYLLNIRKKDVGDGKDNWEIDVCRSSIHYKKE